MKTLYLDNIRGFTETVIPFRDMTFLVGDNSTGKSTVLSVLNALSKFSVTSSGGIDFDSDDIHFGGFTDIVSSSSTDKSRFTIGLCQDRALANQEFQTCIFLSYESNEGLPHLRRLSYVDDSVFVSIRQTKKTLSYRVIPIEALLGKSGLIDSDVMLRLGKLHSSPTNANFKSTRLKVEESNSIIYFVVSSLLSQQFKDKVESAEDFTELDPFKYLSFTTYAVWIAPIRAKPQRSYNAAKGRVSAEGGHTPYVIKKMLFDTKNATRFKNLMDKCGSEGHLFDSVHIKQFGKSEHGPFEVQVKLDGERHSIANVGYGVSQVLPILAEGITKQEGTEYHIQQPEVHLHPKAQSSLGTLFWHLASEENKKFVIETHSDFMIDRFRFETTKSEKHVDTSLLYFERGKNGNKVYELRVSEDGKYPEKQPKGFREFFLNEQLKIFEL